MGRPTKTIIRRWAAENYNSFRRNYTSLNNWAKISVRPFPPDDSCRVLDTQTDPELVPVSQKGSVRQSIISLIQRQRCLSSCTTQDSGLRRRRTTGMARNREILVPTVQLSTIDCHHFGCRWETCTWTGKIRKSPPFQIPINWVRKKRSAWEMIQPHDLI